MFFNYFASIPIYRRIFLCFFLAVLIPDTIIVSTSLLYTQALIAHGTRPAQISPFTIWTMLALVVSTGTVIVLGYVMREQRDGPSRLLDQSYARPGRLPAPADPEPAR